jgi:putative transposase
MESDKTYTIKEIAEITGKHKTSIIRRAKKESWPFINGNGSGGDHFQYALTALPPDIQEAIYNKDANPDLLPVLAPAVLAKVAEQYSPEFPIASLADAALGNGSRKSWTPETAISEKDLQNPRIRRILAILREVEDIPRAWAKGRRKWIEAVALKNDVQWQSIYRWLAKYDKRGIAGIRHEKSSKDKPKKWTPEALDFWVSLCGKRVHRHMNRRDLYDILVIEAQRRGWRIGEQASANWWFNKKWNPLMEAMQRGGVLALDNLLPPVLRDYSDLAPMEILVGDQHRFDRWVVDEETGQVFRPEGYLWQDLRTRIIYGAAVDKKYDAWLIGLALRIGIHCFGAFSSIYTDNGKPECSKFLTAILANLRALGMEWERTEEVVMDVLDVEGEDINPHYIVPGTHRKAVVKNAKAKMIEGTFHVLENIMSSRLRLPGDVKRLSDDIHWQDVDHNEALALAKAGRLRTDREFALAMYLACDYYNRQKHHRGVHREYMQKPKPAITTPFDCLKSCYDEEGWRPRMISAEAADLLFLAKNSRVVNKGRIQFESEEYEHDALMELHGQRLDIRYNPMTSNEIHVFRAGQYLCTAVPVERSSMKDMDLAARKIAEKRERRKRFAEEFRRVTALAPDFREYSNVPEAERVAALIGDERKRRQIAQQELTRPLTQEELDAQVAVLEAGVPLPAPAKRLPARPGYFLDEFARFEWCIKYECAGGELDPADQAFHAAYLTRLTPDQREYWQMAREFGG